MATNIHTAMHDEDVNQYVQASVDYALALVPMHKGQKIAFIDLGCNDGYSTHYATDDSRVKTAIGVELYGEPIPVQKKLPKWLSITFLRENLEDPLLPFKLQKAIQENELDVSEHTGLIFLNHVIEHLYNPYQLGLSLQHIAAKFDTCYLFVAVPDANAPWSTWEGHYSLWTHSFMEAFFANFGFAPSSGQEMRCFRGTNVELWRLFAYAQQE